MYICLQIPITVTLQLLFLVETDSGIEITEEQKAHILNSRVKPYASVTYKETLVQIMACRLVDDKPLSELMLEYC